MAIWNLTHQIGSGTVQAEVADTYKLIRVRATVETVIDEYTVPNLPFEPNTSKIHFGAVVHTGDVERNSLSTAQKNNIDADDDTAFNKKSGQS